MFVFSSGTTGMPKAVRHTHGAFAVAVRHWRDALQLSSADRMQIMTPPSHILGLLNIAMALETGAWIRLHRRFDIDPMLRHIETDRITIEMAVAPIALALAAHPELEKYDLSSLRYVMWCATPVTESVAETVSRRAGVNWVTAYGASELPVISCNDIEGARLDTVGRAVPGVSIRVVSLDTGEAVGPGELGEIQVRSDSVMAGYLPDSATAGAFSDGWYRTGDVGHIDAEGWLRITDRSKEMIKVRGFQVAPAEIEAVLHGHPSVEDCAVFGVPDAADGEAVVAAVKIGAPAQPGAQPVEAQELIALVADSARVVQAAESRGVRGRNTAPAIRKGVASSAEGASVDVRLTSEQQQLRDAAAKLADDLGPGSVADLDDEARIARLEKAVDATGFRTLRSDGASGVEVAIVAEEFARGLVDVPFLGPVMADDLRRALGREPSPAPRSLTSVDLTRSACRSGRVAVGPR